MEQIGVEVHEGLTVTNVTPDGVEVKGGQFLPTRTVVWAAGNTASPLGKTLGVPVDKAGRVVVNEDLTIPDHPEVQVIGDLANFSHQTGKPLPGVSPPAMQEGRHAASNILETLAGGKPMKFVYWDKGSLATIGRNKAVADLNFGVRFGGFIAWVMWAAIHIVYLVGYRSRLAVIGEWALELRDVLPRLAPDHGRAGRPGRAAPPRARGGADGLAGRRDDGAGFLEAVSRPARGRGRT